MTIYETDYFLINFALTFVVFLLFCIIDGVSVTPLFFLLLFPIVCLIIFNLGVGLSLSALFVFFRDLQYLWSVFTMLLMYLSAIFYDVSGFSSRVRQLFLLNPVYSYIRYFRIVVLERGVPSLGYHLLCLGYVIVALLVGVVIYRRCDQKFLYYV